MNKRRRVVLIIGLVAAAAMCLVPPWEVRVDVREGNYRTDKGYALLFTPPAERAEITRDRLLLEALAVAAATGAAFVVLGGGKKPEQ